jgi:hypothetical protein
MAQRRLKKNIKSKRRNKTRQTKKNKTRKYRGGQSYSLPFLTSISPVGISPFHNLY